MPKSKHRLTFVEPGPACAEEDVAALEKTLEAKLPGDYRAYLLGYNGAQPILDGREYDAAIVRLHWPKKPARAGDNVATFGHFLRLQAASPDVPDLRETLSDFAARLPEKTLPIANDPGGSQFLLSLGEDRTGAVFYWSRKHQGDAAGRAIRDYPNVALVAPSFTEFLACLEPEPEDWDKWERENA